MLSSHINPYNTLYGGLFESLNTYEELDACHQAITNKERDKHLVKHLVKSLAAFLTGNSIPIHSTYDSYLTTKAVRGRWARRHVFVRVGYYQVCCSLYSVRLYSAKEVVEYLLTFYYCSTCFYSDEEVIWCGKGLTMSSDCSSHKPITHTQ